MSDDPPDLEGPASPFPTAMTGNVRLKNANILLPDDGPPVAVHVPKFTLAADQFGLVVGPPLEADGGDLKIKGAGVDPQEVRFAALFWDALVFPRSNLVAIGLGSDASYLQTAGVLRTVDVELRGKWPAGTAVRAVYEATLRALIARDGDRWSLARGENSPSVFTKNGASNGTLVFDLHSVIPVPDKQVPLAEVLEFKLKRNAELVNLRSRLNEVLKAIVADPERDLAQVREMDRLAAAIEDHLKVSLETKLPLRLTGIKSRIDMKVLKAARSAAVEGYAFATTVGVSHTLAALIGGVTGAAGGYLASLSADLGVKQKVPEGSPYEYVSRYHKDLFRNAQIRS